MLPTRPRGRPRKVQPSEDVVLPSPTTSAPSSVAVLDEDELPEVFPEPLPAKKTYTNWDAFNKARIVPTTIICDVIHAHPADEACKSRLPLTAAQLIRHTTEQGHGGGFQIKVKQVDSGARPWAGWKDLETAGYEVTSLKCEVCDQRVQVSARDINNHLRPHRGKFRGAYQNYRDTFFLQIQATPVQDDDESYIEEY
jgi:hypothetical protein